MELDRVISPLGKADQVNLGVMVNTEVVFPAEMDFCSAFARTEFIALDQDEVDDTFFKSLVSGSLDIHITVDIAQPGIAVTVVFSLGRREHKTA